MNAAVDAYMGDPTRRLFIFGDLCRLDVKAVASAHPFARNNLRSVIENVAPMARFLLRILRQRPQGGVETDREWLDANTAEQAIAQAAAIANVALAGQSGIAMLSDPAEKLLWSHRENMPRPDGRGNS